MKVKNDIFHILNGIGRTMRRHHGAFVVFIRKLRDVFFKLCADDFEAETRKLLASGKSVEEVAEMKRTNWGYFLRQCRRIVPTDRRKMLHEFNLVCEQFACIKDAKTNKELFTPETYKKVKQVRRHIAAGTLSDPEGVSMYIPLHKDGEPT